MVDINRITTAITGLDDLHQRLCAFQKGEIIRGSVFPTNDYIDETLLCLDTAVRILTALSKPYALLLSASTNETGDTPTPTILHMTSVAKRLKSQLQDS